MKLYLTFIFLVMFSGYGYSQIDFEDRSSNEKAIVPVPYTGQFEVVDYNLDKAEILGLIGEQVTLLDVSYRNVYPSKDAKEKYQPAGYDKAELFENKTFTITDYYKDIYDCFVIKNNSGEFHWDVTSTSVYVFNKLIETNKKRYVGIQMTPFLYSNKTEDLNGNSIEFDGNQNYTVTDVKYSKFKGSGDKYGFVLELSEGMEFRLPDETLRYRRTYNGEIWERDDRFLYVQSGGLLPIRTLMVKSDEMDGLVSKYPKHLSTARAGKVAVGMTEELVYMSWGMADRNHINLAGCAKVVVYGSQNLCFDKVGNGVLTKIF